MSTRVRELEETSAEDRSRIEALEKGKSELLQALEVKTSEEARLWEDLRSLETKCTAAEAEIKVRDVAADELTEKYRASVDAYEKMRAALEVEKAQAAVDRKALGSELLEKEKEEERLKDGFREAREMVEQLVGKVSGLEAALEKDRAALATLEEDAKRLDCEKQAALKDAGEKAVELKSLGNLSAGLQKDLAERGKEMETLKARVRELEKNLESDRASFEEDKKRLEEERHRIEKDLACRVEQNLIAHKEIEERIAEIAASERERARLTEEGKKMRGEIDVASSRIQDLERAAAFAATQIQQFRTQCSDLEKEKGKAFAEGGEKARALEDLTKTLREKEALLSEKIALQKDLEERLENEKREHAKSQSRARSFEATLLDLEKKINDLTSR
ncbi:MAG: hypothetical protein V1882_02680 [Candidatus Omnitrophota bacterium]